MGITKQQEPEWITTAPIQIYHHVVIERDATWVWNRFADDDGWEDWFPGFRQCRYTSQPPYGQGSIRFVHQDQFKVHERITKWVPERRWAMTVTEINAPIVAAMAEDVTFTPAGDSTEVSFLIGVELTSVGSLLRRPLQARATKALHRALANLERLPVTD